MKILTSSGRLASMVRFHRKRAGLSQVDLASLAAVSRKVVQEIEAGSDGVSWCNLTSVLTVLNIHLVPEGPLIDEWLSEGATTLSGTKEKEGRRGGN